jgi:hypothetical protein
MHPKVSIRQALNDPQLLAHALAGPSWRIWTVVMLAALGETLTEDERKLFESVSNRPQEPGELVAELFCIIARRGGKSRTLSVLAAYLAALCDHPLTAGEVGVCLLIAPDVHDPADPQTRIRLPLVWPMAR